MEDLLLQTLETLIADFEKKDALNRDFSPISNEILAALEKLQGINASNSKNLVLLRSRIKSSGYRMVGHLRKTTDYEPLCVTWTQIFMGVANSIVCAEEVVSE